MTHAHVAAPKTVKLAAMANQIALFFASYPHEQGVAGVAQHITKFWTPGMRETLHGQALRGDPALSTLVVAAMLAPKRVASPALNEAAGDAAQCDAG